MFHKQDFVREERLRSKSLYKLFLILVKYTPFLLAITDILHTTLSYFSINCYFLSCFGGVSLVFLGLLYILSELFRFCYLYRFPLHYIVVTNLLALYDNTIGIPVTDINMFRIYLIIFGIFMLIFIFKTVYGNAKHHKKSSVEVH